MAEWSKALVLGTSLLGGVGSNPTTANFAILKSMVLWCSGYHICLTRRRSPVRNRAAPLPLFAQLPKAEEIHQNGDAGVRTPDLLHAKQALYH